MELITATAKMIGVPNPRPTLAILAAPEVLPATVQLKFKAKPIGRIAVTVAVPTTLIVAKKRQLPNLILKAATPAVSPKLITVATTIL